MGGGGGRRRGERNNYYYKWGITLRKFPPLKKWGNGSFLTASHTSLGHNLAISISINTIDRSASVTSPHSSHLRFLQVVIDVVFGDGGIGDEVEEPLQRQHPHVLSPEELVDVVAVFAQKLEGVRVIHLHRLKAGLDERVETTFIGYRHNDVYNLLEDTRRTGSSGIGKASLR